MMMQIKQLKKRMVLRRPIVTSLMMCLCVGLLVSCSKYNLDEIYPDFLKSSIYDYLKDEGKYTNFVQLIDDLDYSGVLKTTGSKTLFVADDDAFDRFYQSNVWGVTSYSQLTLAQKKLLVQGAMLDNSMQVDKLSTAAGALEGKAMRRMVSGSIYDSVPVIAASEMPDNAYWRSFKARDHSIYCLKDMTAAPILCFTETFLTNNLITNADFDFIHNIPDGSPKARKPGDASFNGVLIETPNIRCRNGFVNKMAEVVVPKSNMAEAIRKNPSLSQFSRLLERFSAPYYSKAATDEFNRLYNAAVDSVFEKSYFSERTHAMSSDPKSPVPVDGTTRVLSVDPNNKPVNGTLKFDPGWNKYIAAAGSQTDKDVLLQQDMGVMLVPSDSALDDYWNNKGGKVLKNYYGTWDNVPDKVVAVLIKNNQLNSFVNSVPSKFPSVLNDANDVMGLQKKDVNSVQLCDNGALYITNKVFGPTAFRSVSFPSLINESMNIMYWGIQQLEYYAYLNSMDSYYSFFIPTNNAMLMYIDPVSFAQTSTKVMRFHYNAKATAEIDKVWASVYEYDINTGQMDSIIGGDISSKTMSSSAANAIIKDRLRDLLDYHIVVGNVEDGKTFYKTKGGGTIKVLNGNTGTSAKVYGGFQSEQGQHAVVSEVYNMSQEGNGKSYILDGTPLLTSQKSVYDILKDHPEFTKFCDLMIGSGYQETVRDGKYAAASLNGNVSLFNTYNYTVYVPSEASINKLQRDGYLPTLDDISYVDSLRIEADDAGDIVRRDSLQKYVELYKERLRNFVKYHIQDNSVYIGDGVAVSESLSYETAAINSVTGRFYKLTVSKNASDGELSVTDNCGHTRKVNTSDPALYNQMAREYLLNASDASKATEIETSSFAVVHRIDEPLFFTESQYTVKYPKPSFIRRNQLKKR
jgi:uncharacterized surface protein with fasciclin (FAS1) repeats